jgi:comEA protein
MRGERRVLILLFIAVLGMSSLAALGEPKKVDLNVAGLQELESLPGIGPTMAQRIITFREENGPFEKIEDLMNVKGIGEKRFLQLKDLITVAKPQAAQPAEANLPG